MTLFGGRGVGLIILQPVVYFQVMILGRFYGQGKAG